MSQGAPREKDKGKAPISFSSTTGQSLNSKPKNSKMEF